MRGGCLKSYERQGSVGGESTPLNTLKGISMRIRIKLRDDRKLLGIKLIRMLTQSGLKEAKDLFEAILPWRSFSSSTRYGYAIVETDLSLEQCRDAAKICESEIDEVQTPDFNTMSVSNADSDNMIISIKSTNISGELFINKKFAEASDFLSLLSKALSV